MKPTSVLVHRSDCPMFPLRERSYSFEEFERLALCAVHLFPENGSRTNCTEVTVHFSSGEEVLAHLDLIGLEGTFGAQDFLTDILMTMIDKNGDPDAIDFLRSVKYNTH